MIVFLKGVILRVRGRCVPSIPPGLGPAGDSGATLPRRAGSQWCCPSQARRHLTSWGTSRVRWWKEGLGDCDFFECWNSPKPFLPGVISKHWGPSGRAASLKPLDGEVGTTREVLVPPNTRIPPQDMVFCSQTIERSYGGALMQSSDHVEQILTWTYAYSLKMTCGLQHMLGLRYMGLSIGLKYMLKWLETLDKT